MTNLFIARFLAVARCGLIGARRCSSIELGKAPSSLYIFGRLGSRAPGLEAQASRVRVRQHNKLLP
jgi:hypothetical protein